MTAIDSAKAFVMNEVLMPARESTKLDNKSAAIITNSITWLQHFERVGDLARYLTRFRDVADSHIFKSLRAAGLQTFEDIRPRFLAQFSAYLDDRTRLDDFVLGQQYSSQQILIFAGRYDLRSGGMFPIRKVPHHSAVFIKATLSDGKYPNAWIREPDRLKYFLKGRSRKDHVTFKESFIENRAIIDYPTVPIYAFVRPTDEGTYTLKGLFRNQKVHTEEDGSKWFELLRIDAASGGATIAERELRDEVERNVAQSRRIPRDERLVRLANAPRKPTKILVAAVAFARNPDVIAEVLERAAGTCEVCKNPAPFKRAKDGTPYLEVHHIVQLANGGDDTVENAVAACPNCHRREHFGIAQLSS